MCFTDNHIVTHLLSNKPYYPIQNTGSNNITTDNIGPPYLKLILANKIIHISITLHISAICLYVCYLKTTPKSNFYHIECAHFKKQL